MGNIIKQLFYVNGNNGNGKFEKNEEIEPEPAVNSGNDFYVDFHRYFMSLAKKFHDVPDHMEIMHESIQAAYDFYDAEWAGILTADPITKMWAPTMWLSKRTGWNSETLFDEYEVFENYPRWVESLQTGQTLVIEDRDKLEDLSETERSRYEKFNAKGLIGAPFGQGNPTGFMVIKNPHRYKTNTDFAEMIALVGLSTLYLDDLLKEIDMTRNSDGDLQDDNSVCIKLFGIPSIQTKQGSVDATQYKSQQAWELITYLALVDKPVPSKLIADKLWADAGGKDNKQNDIRGIRYRFIKALEPLKTGGIIHSSDEKSGYEINHDIPISIDVWEFERLIKEAKVTRDTLKKIELLKQAISLYDGTIYKEVSDKEWLMSYAIEYDSMYEKAVMELMELYDKTGDYISMHQATIQVLEYIPENVDLYYWTMKALAGIGSMGVMKKEMDQIATHLTEEEYGELKEKLGEDFKY